MRDNYVIDKGDIGEISIEKIWNEKRKIVLWGCGKYAEYMIKYIQADKRDGLFRIEFVLDNSSDKQKESFYGLPVKNPKNITEWKELFIIVAVNNGYWEIVKQLNAYGLKSNKDFTHWQKLCSRAVLGISALYHDSAAALIVNGEIIAAAQEERFTRVKHDPGFPEHAIQYCMEEAGLDYEDLDAVVYYDNPLLTADRLLHNIVAVGEKGDALIDRNLKMLLTDKVWIHHKIELFSKGKISKKKVFVAEHHISYAASAYYASPFMEAAVLCFDGVGEWGTSSIGIGKDNKLTIIKQIDYPDSLGLLYSAFTFFCGFKVNSGEYKLMGLAPYGEPIYYDVIKQNIVTIFEDGSYRLHLEYFNFYLGGNMTNEKFAELFGGEAREPESEITKREMDIAASIQKVTEEIVIKAAVYAKKITGCSNLCFAGGTALNCVANGILLRKKIFDRIWIPPAAGDAGGALGAAYYLYYGYWDMPRMVGNDDCRKRNIETANWEKAFQSQEVMADYNAWKDYGKCRNIRWNIMPYDFEYPIELKKYLNELWENDSSMDKDFINRLIVSIFRQKSII